MVRKTRVPVSKIVAEAEKRALPYLKPHFIPVNDQTVKAFWLGYRIAAQVFLEKFDETILEFGVNPVTSMVKKRIQFGLKDITGEASPLS